MSERQSGLCEGCGSNAYLQANLCEACYLACPCYLYTEEPVWCPVHERQWSMDVVLTFVPETVDA